MQNWLVCFSLWLSLCREGISNAGNGYHSHRCGGYSLGFIPICQAYGNTPALVGEGMILYDCAGVYPEQEQAFKTLFAKAGVLDKLADVYCKLINLYP